MKKLYFLFLLLIASSISCNDDDPTLEAITVSRIGGQLNLLNNTDQTLYLFIIDQDELAVINWAPSVDANQPKIDPNGQARIALTEVIGFTNETSVIVVNYWEGIMVDGELIAGEVNQILFNL